MKKIAFCALLLTCNIVCADPSAVNKLQNHLNKINSMQATFEQKVFSEHKKLLHTYHGNMAFKKPNMFRWQVEKPEETLLVTDGKSLWNYDIGLEQVTIQKYTANKDVSPISFVLDDPNKLASNFDVGAAANDCFKLTPKKDNPNFVQVAVCFKRDNIASVEINDHFGQTSMFYFSHIKHNQNIANAKFSFTPPAGVDVIGEN
jgi:outer membrane lipoprotein carrier protein